MDRVVSLSSPDLDWELLAHLVECGGHPLWLELGGVIRGVLLPTDVARQLMGQYMQANAGPPTLLREAVAPLGRDPTLTE